MEYKIVKVKKWQDERGYLAEFLTRKEIDNPQKKFGHMYFVTFVKPGIVRGNHYHARKKEYFGLAMGKAKFILEDIKTKERKMFILSADSRQFIRLQIGPNIAHAVQSLTNNVVLIDYFSFPYNPKHPDSFKYILIESKK